MGFNNGRERRKFEDAWKKLRRQYRDAGFSEQGIDAMHAFDEDAYRSRRRFEEHTQPFPSEEFTDGTPQNWRSVFAKFENLSTSFDENGFTGRSAWVDAVGDPVLVSGLKRLNPGDLELLTLYAIESRNQQEIAQLLGCSQKTISSKLIRIKKVLGNFK